MHTRDLPLLELLGSGCGPGGRGFESPRSPLVVPGDAGVREPDTRLRGTDLVPILLRGAEVLWAGVHAVVSLELAGYLEPEQAADRYHVVL